MCSFVFAVCHLRIKFLQNTGVTSPWKWPLQTGLIWRALECPIVVTGTMTLTGVGEKTQNTDVWLLKIIRWKLVFLYLHSHHGNLVTWHWCRGSPLKSVLKKALFSAHCVQNLIYRSWPWLLFCATTTLENNGRKAWNLRGTESALFHFFSALIEWRIFPPRVK